MEREIERLKEREPGLDRYDAVLRLAIEKARQRREGKVVVRGEEVPWQQTRNALAKMLVCELDWDQVGAPGWRVILSRNVTEVRGKHTHTGGGVLIYILEGRGYTVNNGVRLDWEAGDLELLPVTPFENVHQHFNLTPGAPYEWVAFVFWPFAEAVAFETRQMEQSKDYRGEVAPELQRPADFVAKSAYLKGMGISYDGSLLDELFRRRDEWRREVASAPLVVKGANSPAERNRMGLYRWYIHPTLRNLASRHVLFWTHEIPPGSRSGKQKHQGGRVHYVAAGRGYTILDDKRYDWESGDVILLPVKAGGCVFQHFNADARSPVKLVVAEPNWTGILGPDLAAGFEQLENSPHYPG